MKTKQRIHISFMYIFNRKKYTKITELIKRGWDFKSALSFHETKERNKISEDCYKTIERISKIADIIQKK